MRQELVDLRMSGVGSRWGLRLALEGSKLEHYCEGLCMAGIGFK